MDPVGMSLDDIIKKDRSSYKGKRGSSNRKPFMQK